MYFDEFGLNILTLTDQRMSKDLLILYQILVRKSMLNWQIHTVCKQNRKTNKSHREVKKIAYQFLIA